MLISAGFGVNNYDFLFKTCLDIAVENHHYSAVRFLLKHEARSCFDFNDTGVHDPYLEYHHATLKPVIISLVSQANVPLDLFDVLATPQSLNDSSQCRYLPLHEAACHGRTDNACHLIKLGASVDQLDGFSRLPIDYFLEKRTKQFNNELFRIVLPKCAHGVNILMSI